MTGRFRLLLLLALVIDYAAIFFLLFVWQNVLWTYFLSFVVCFCFGLVVERSQDFIVLWVLSYLLASFLAVLLFVSPFLYPYVGIKVELGALGAMSMLAYNSIVIVPISICSGFVGLFFGERFFRRFRPRFSFE